MSDSLSQKVAKIIKLKGVGEKSFIELCAKGCDPEELANYLVFITHPSKIKITSKNKRRKQTDISLRPLDTSDEALKGLDKRDLEALQKSVLKLATKIQKVNQTRVVRYLEIDREEYNTDIHMLPHLLIYYAKEFIPVVLDKTAKTGKRQRPYYNRFLNDMIDHIEEKTGDPNYKLICDVMNQFEIGEKWNEGSLKQWRYRHSASGKDLP